jgi:dTDP-4-dehydrorhamnose reductase
VKALIIGSDCVAGIELAANLQGRDIPFASLSSRDPALDSAKLLTQALHAQGISHVVNVLTRELFSRDDSAALKRGLVITTNLCKACRAQGAALIHLSDDRMFHGRKGGAYREKDKPDNANPLAQHVLKGERYVGKRVPRQIVLRCGPLVAPGGDNLLTVMFRRLEAGQRIECSTDKICPTPANDLARVVVALILQIDCGAESWGTYHYCSSDAVSLYNFAESVVAIASQFGRIDREKVKLEAQEGEGRNIILNCHQLLGAFGIQQRPWRAALPSIVAEYCGR